jgi:hypothetical protein
MNAIKSTMLAATAAIPCNLEGWYPSAQTTPLPEMPVEINAG